MVSLSSIPLFLSHLAAAVSIDCEHIRVDGKSFDLSKLAGRHAVSVHDTSRPPAEYNTTWTLDLCAPLKKLEGIRNEDQCPQGTRGNNLAPRIRELRLILSQSAVSWNLGTLPTIPTGNTSRSKMSFQWQETLTPAPERA